MEGSASIHDYLEVLLLLLFIFTQAAQPAPDTPQLPQDSVPHTSSSPPSAETEDSDPNVNNTARKNRSSSSPPPTGPHDDSTTSTSAALFSGAHDFVFNNSSVVVQNPQGDRDIVAHGEDEGIRGYLINDCSQLIPELPQG